MSKTTTTAIVLIATMVISIGLTGILGGAQEAVSTTGTNASLPWWEWSLMLFFAALILSALAVLSGVSAGVLFVPIIGALFPFHLDFVRGMGLLVGIASAFPAVSALMKRNFADLRLALPAALIASVCAIVGAIIGLSLPDDVLRTALGATILGIVVIMRMSRRKSAYPEVKKADFLSTALGIHGILYDPTSDSEIQWQTHRTLRGLAAFAVVGVITGMFGLSAGWANVSVLNLIMGAPLKVSVATSRLLLSITDTSAAWIYMNNGSVLPIMIAPSIFGSIFGTVVGVQLLAKRRFVVIRYIVMVMLLCAGFKFLFDGLAN
ncbi:MAG: sulfite exporter TauE/SafE family protein [Dissulfurispiraceae bacterium]